MNQGIKSFFFKAHIHVSWTVTTSYSTFVAILSRGLVCQFILSWPPDKLLPSVGFRSLARRRFRFGCVSLLLSDICLFIFF